MRNLLLLFGLLSYGSICFGNSNETSTANYPVDYNSYADYNLRKTLDCEWRYEGCVTPGQIDMRSYAKRMLDDVFACKNTREGCTPEELESQKKLTHSVRGQTWTPEEVRNMIDEYSKQHPKAAKGKWIPFDAVKKNELISIAVATSLGVVFFYNDEEINDFVQENKNGTTAELAKIGNYFGREVIPPVALGSYFLGVVIKNNKIKRFGLITVTTGLATQLITEAFKISVGRSRPKHGEGAYSFGTENKSFFSGHSSGAWSFATAIAETFGDDNKYIPYVSYGLATLTSLARMHDNKHWASDVLVGALVGHFVTKKIIRSLINKDGSGFMVYPGWDLENGGYNINFQYYPKRPRTTRKKSLCTQLPEGRLRMEACLKEHLVWN